MINRKKLVTRHNIRNLSDQKCFPIGNGEFCFTGDFTGLQTFRGNCMSHWGWHDFPAPEGVDPAKLPETGCYMDHYPEDGVESLPTDKTAEIQYMIQNPHIFNLGRIGFVHADGRPLSREELTPGSFLLNLYDGIATTDFTYQENKISVSVMASVCQDGIIARIGTDNKPANLAVEIAFPYPELEFRNWIGDFDAEDRHQTTVHILAGSQCCVVERTVDDISYTVECTCRNGSFVRTGNHSLKLNLSESGITEFAVSFSEGTRLEQDAFISNNLASKKGTLECPDFDSQKQQVTQHWHHFWDNGGAIDLSQSKDSRWHELERRIVLSQYLLAVQSAGSYPSAEAGLMNLDVWNGCFHMEMAWWHIAHYGLWGRMDMADRQLSIYQKFLPVAEALAGQLNKKGARWGKQVGPNGRSAPWTGNISLYWKQPHPIFFAELEYRNRPSEETLQKWDEVIRKTAEHMADCAVKKEDGYYHLLNVMPPSELGFTDDPVFDLTYWQWALGIANDWQERLGRKRNAEWEDICKNMAPLPVQDGVYLRSAEWVNTYTEQTYEHPDPVGIYGMLPPTDCVDYHIAKNTLNKIWEVWQKNRIWGWDFAWIAMCAARVGEPEIAVESLLLMEIDEIGANGNGSDPYLPANGGLLYAAALMCVGAKGEHAPGFPADGQWVVECENIMGW